MPSQTIELDFSLILESLAYTKLNYESTQYPTYELKREQIQRVENAIAQVRELRDRENA